MYIAYICYPHQYDYDDEEAQQPEIRFEEPERYLYKQIVPISFHPLMSWTNKDKNLFKRE